jgi:hypothetical protein
MIAEAEEIPFAPSFASRVLSPVTRIAVVKDGETTVVPLYPTADRLTTLSPVDSRLARHLRWRTHRRTARNTIVKSLPLPPEIIDPSRLDTLTTVDGALWASCPINPPWLEQLGDQITRYARHRRAAQVGESSPPPASPSSPSGSHSRVRQAVALTSLAAVTSSCVAPMAPSKIEVAQDANPNFQQLASKYPWITDLEQTTIDAHGHPLSVNTRSGGLFEFPVADPQEFSQDTGDNHDGEVLSKVPQQDVEHSHPQSFPPEKSSPPSHPSSTRARMRPTDVKDLDPKDLDVAAETRLLKEYQRNLDESLTIIPDTDPESVASLTNTFKGPDEKAFWEAAFSPDSDWTIEEQAIIAGVTHSSCPNPGMIDVVNANQLLLTKGYETRFYPAGVDEQLISQALSGDLAAYGEIESRLVFSFPAVLKARSRIAPGIKLLEKNLQATIPADDFGGQLPHIPAKLDELVTFTWATDNRGGNLLTHDKGRINYPQFQESLCFTHPQTQADLIRLTAHEGILHALQPLSPGNPIAASVEASHENYDDLDFQLVHLSMGIGEQIVLEGSGFGDQETAISPQTFTMFDSLTAYLDDDRQAAFDTLLRASVLGGQDVETIKAALAESGLDPQDIPAALDTDPSRITQFVHK